jgi:hypothetical protein
MGELTGVDRPGELALNPSFAQGFHLRQGFGGQVGGPWCG